jgi:hypothetical protein
VSTFRPAALLLFVATLALVVAACEHSQRTARSVEPVAQQATNKVKKGAKATGQAAKPVVAKVGKGFEKGVQGIKKGGDAVGRALGAK